MILSEYDEELHIASEKEISREEGLEEGIRAMILDNLEESVPAERNIQKLQRFFGLDYEGASDLLLACTGVPHGEADNKNSA